eukprot:366380-Chlamydomonas_euryale.AAC.18
MHVRRGATRRRSAAGDAARRAAKDLSLQLTALEAERHLSAPLRLADDRHVSSSAARVAPSARCRAAAATATRTTRERAHLPTEADAARTSRIGFPQLSAPGCRSRQLGHAPRDTPLGPADVALHQYDTGKQAGQAGQVLSGMQGKQAVCSAACRASRPCVQRHAGQAGRVFSGMQGKQAVCSAACRLVMFSAAGRLAICPAAGLFAGRRCHTAVGAHHQGGALLPGPHTCALSPPPCFASTPPLPPSVAGCTH